MPLRSEFVRQRELNDCGVACLAMAAGVEYESAKAVFDALGLGNKACRSAGFGNFGNGALLTDHLRPAYSSNFQEMSTALQTLGLQPKVKRFRGWENVKNPSIVKVSNGHKTNWHWVYANRSTDSRLHVFDPACDLESMDQEWALKVCLNTDLYKPRGCFIEIERVAS